MFVFTQLPPQFVPEQTSWQLPFTQLVPFWQTVPQEPQLRESVFVFIQVLPQRIVPDGQIPADEGAPVGVGVEGAPVGVEVGGAPVGVIPGELGDTRRRASAAITRSPPTSTTATAARPAKTVRRE